MTRNEGAGFVWRLGYATQGCWRRLGAGFRETKLFASFWGMVTRNGPVGVVWGFSKLVEYGGSVTHLVGLPILGSPLGFLHPLHPISIVQTPLNEGSGV